MSKTNLAIVSDQLISRIGGAERLLFSVFDLFPDAPVYTTLLDRDILPEIYKNKEIHAGFIQSLPFPKKLYKAYFPLMPLEVELFDLQQYDVIFSSHHCVAKGVIPRPDAVHICYCHSPARYIWDLFWTYSNLNQFNPLQKIAVSAMSQYIRIWDVTSSNRVDYFIANSRYTAKRVRKYYNREAEVLYPPIDTENFSYQGSDDFYLMAGRIVAYKGFEAAIDAFNESGKPLVIIGDGPEYAKYKAKAKNNIKMPGTVPYDLLVKYMNTCKAFVFPGKEDFGIVMAEAQAAGKPVIALKGGGALDIVVENETGLLFENSSIESINHAVSMAEKINWDHISISKHAEKFAKSVFTKRIQYLIQNYEELKK